MVASRDIVGYSAQTLLVLQDLSIVLLEQMSSYLSRARWREFNATLIEMPDITVKQCTLLNSATLLTDPDDSEEHN